MPLGDESGAIGRVLTGLERVSAEQGNCFRLKIPRLYSKQKNDQGVQRQRELNCINRNVGCGSIGWEVPESSSGSSTGD